MSSMVACVASTPNLGKSLHEHGSIIRLDPTGEGHHLDIPPSPPQRVDSAGHGFHPKALGVPNWLAGLELEATRRPSFSPPPALWVPLYTFVSRGYVYSLLSAYLQPGPLAGSTWLLTQLQYNNPRQQ
jgi:hypothetical protein